MRVVCVRVGELAGKTRDGAASVQVHVCVWVCVCLRCWDQIKSEIVFEMKHLFCGYKLFLRWSDLISCSTPLGSAESSSQTRDRLSIKHPPRLRRLRWQTSTVSLEPRFAKPPTVGMSRPRKVPPFNRRIQFRAAFKPHLLLLWKSLFRLIRPNSNVKSIPNNSAIA